MGQVHVRRITLQAFRAFQTKQSSPELPSHGLVGIRGRDLATGVSSGAGKSTVPLAIAYAFGFCPFPANQQQNWHTNLPMQVELELDTPTGPAIIRRGKEFSLTWNGKTTQGSAKAVEEEIRKMMGLPTNLLEALTYRQQQERGRFLSMTDQEKKSFLGTLLGAEELEQQIADSVKKSNALQVEVEQLAKVIEALSAQLTPPSEPVLEPVPEIKLLPLPPEPDMEPLRILEAALKECEARILKKHAENVSTQVSGKLRAEHTAKNAELSTVYRYRDQQERLEQEIAALSNGECPTCSGPWLDERKLSQKHQQLDIIKVTTATIPRRLAELARLEKEIATAEEAERASDELKQQLLGLMKVQGDLIKSSMEEGQRVNAAKREIEDVRGVNERQLLKVEWAKKANERALSDYKTHKAAYDKAVGALEVRKRELETKKQLVAEEADYAAALKAYLGGLFDEVLAQISTETNELLRNVPNTPTTTVTFVSDNVTQKGTTRQEIKPVIIKNGKQADLRSGISGGQLETVELAVDLSIAKVIGQRTGVRPGFMIFDESFSAHCVPTKEACMQVLKQAAQECLILVVDHATELRDYFDAFIDVESDRDVSSFSIQG